MIDYKFASTLALRAVTEAGHGLMAQTDRTVVGTKGSHRDVVTAADVEAQALILKTLREGQDYPIIAEEDPGAADVFTDDAQPCWFVDPLDGTVNYAHDLSLFSVSAGLSVGRTFAVGAVCLPALSELYFTQGDQISYLNGRLLKLAPAVYEKSLIAISFSGKRGDPQARQRQYQVFGALNDETRGCLRTGSAAINVCYVAANRLQAALGYAAKLWDVAGALAIARCAGAKLFVRPSQYGEGVDYIVGSPAVVTAVRACCAAKGAPIGHE